MKKPMPAFMQKKADKKSASSKPKAYAKGGGIESKGKTRGKVVKMMGGGSCK